MAKNQRYDDVSYPRHYVQGGIETMDFILAKKLNYLAGNVIKYIVRYEHKDNPTLDLEKARFYLDRLIKEVEKE